MTKIAFFLPNLAGGGAERVCINLAAGFLARGMGVDFVLVKAEGQLMQAVPAGAKVIDLSAPRTLTAVLPLTSYLRREEPYALIAAPTHANLVAIWAKILTGVKTLVVITTHNYLSIVVRQTPKIQEKLYPYFLRLFQRHADHIVAVSQGVADDLARTAHIPRERISVIYNPVVHPELDHLKSQPLSHPWFADGQPPVVLAVGRLTPQKDYPTLLRAFALLRMQRPVRLVVLGDGQLLAELNTLSVQLGIASDVDFPGFDPNPYRYMKHCSVFVLSSAWEGFSVVLAEALACGAQIVSTDCPSGPAEILENGKFGRLVPVGDEAALARAVEATMDSPLPADMLRGRAEDFSVDAAVEKYLGVLGLS
jgi:glycosyltransferase involved in cell wall biosynthesis